MLTKTRDTTKSRKKPLNKKVEYPHISSNKDILNGIPIINGTRVSVKTIAGYYQMGMSVDEILNTVAHVSQSQVHSALAYYFDHQIVIDKEILEDNQAYYLGKNKS